MLAEGLQFTTFSQMVFSAWEYAHEDDMFRFFSQALKSLRLYSTERQQGIVDSLICYLNNVIRRQNLEDSMEEKCRDLARYINDTVEGKQVSVSVQILPQLLEKKVPLTKKRKSRLALG